MQEIITWFCMGRKDYNSHYYYCYYYLILVVTACREVLLGDYFLFVFLLGFFCEPLIVLRRRSLKTHVVKSWPR